MTFTWRARRAQSSLSAFRVLPLTGKFAIACVSARRMHFNKCLRVYGTGESMLSTEFGSIRPSRSSFLSAASQSGLARSISLASQSVSTESDTLGMSNEITPAGRPACPEVPSSLAAPLASR
eukprot:scaffold3568_cov380-Prasinococcus_capsulatus_cf.AAC.6